MKNKVLLFFLPDLQIYPFSRGMAAFADAMQRYNKTAYLTGCTGEFTRCPVMDMYKIPSCEVNKKKKILCPICINMANKFNKIYNIPILYLNNYINSQDKKEIQTVVENTPNNELLSFTWRGWRIGYQAFPDLILSSKNANPDLQEPQRAEYFRAYLRTSMEAFLIMERISEQLSPESVVFCQEYAIRHGSANVCRTKKIPFVFTSVTTFLGYDMGRFYITPLPYISYVQKLTSAWPHLRSVPVSANAVQASWDDVYFRNFMHNHHVFSPSKSGKLEELSQVLHLEKERKTLIAYTSSEDELLSGRYALQSIGESFSVELVFPDQLTWLTSLCDYVSARDDLQLVIRIHPRMGAVKGANAAPLLEEYKKAFASLPAHCTVLWPESPVSSYDLAELADLALISWSTMGRELFRIGVPVLGCAKNFYYVDDDFIHVPEDAPSYFAELDAMLRQTYTLDTLRRAIRYQTMLTFGPTINLAPGIPNVSVVTPEDEPVIPRVDDENLSKLYQLLTVQDDIFSMNMQHTLCDNKNNLTSEKQEEEAIVAGIGHYIESLFCPFQNPEDDIFQLMKEFKQKDGTIAIPRATAPRLQKILDLAKQAKLNSVRPGWAKRKLRCSSDFARLPMYLGSGLIN